MMKNILISVFILLALFFIAYFYKNKSDEKAVVECVNNVADSMNVSGIKTNATDRIHSPIISGTISTKQKQEFKKLIEDKCQVTAFEDLIVEENDYDIKYAHINFQLDGFNKTGSITGMVNSTNEQQEVLANFTDALNKHYGPWTVMHDIIVAKQVQKSEFPTNISLVFSAISMIRVTDITLTNSEIILKGLVRSKADEEYTITQLQQIFQSDLEIVNQLEPVVKEENDEEELDFEIKPYELPDIKPPNT